MKKSSEEIKEWKLESSHKVLKLSDFLASIYYDSDSLNNLQTSGYKADTGNINRISIINLIYGRIVFFKGNVCVCVGGCLLSLMQQSQTKTWIKIKKLKSWNTAYKIKYVL